jgi:type III restriction enzyme
MKFTLTDYQAEAVSELLTQLKTAKALYKEIEPFKESSVALTAPTGAGKTVMAAAAIEALFFGSDQFGFDPDPTATVIWFSDDPNLNEQSRYRLMQASEKLTHNRLVVVKPPFSVQTLDSGKVYFVNTQRFSKNSLLVRGHEPVDPASALFDFAASPDFLAYNIFQTIANTIEDEGRTLYFVLDEAHRGFDKARASTRTTIVSRLVTGVDTGLPMPIVVGISATIGKFKSAMRDLDRSEDRVALAEVNVEPSRVVASGLIKDTVQLMIPDEPGDFSSTLVLEAARRLHASTITWKKYCLSQKMAEPVVPLLVVQIPNTPEHDDVGYMLDRISSVIPEITSSNVRNVLGENKVETFGAWTVDYIEPQRVQETTSVRVLIAKDAISTGWDCPRAEVLLSFRPARDQTHIAQLLGRMVRNPLARRIPGSDALNSVECILPNFDKTTAGNVVRYMTGEVDGLPEIGGSRVLLSPKELGVNKAISPAVWESFDNLPTQTVPKRGVKPVKRWVSLALALSEDGIRPGSIGEIQAHVNKLLDSLTKTHIEEVKKQEKEVDEVNLQVLSGNHGEAGVRYSKRLVSADAGAVRTAFETAKEVFGSDLAFGFVNHLVDVHKFDLQDAYVRASALATVKEVQEILDKEVATKAFSWFSEHKLEINVMSDERQQEYEKIRSLATEPQTSDMIRPRNRLEDFSVVVGEKSSEPAPLVKLHLMADENGDYPVGMLNGWEIDVLNKEMKRLSALGWYRNPAHNGLDSVCISYKDSQGNWRGMHPDFVFFHEIDGAVLPSIVDPHGQHLDDSMVKLVGLANFAERYGDKFHRIEAVAKDGSRWRKLDLKREDVRLKIAQMQDSTVTSLYGDPVSEEYV